MLEQPGQGDVRAGRAMLLRQTIERFEQQVVAVAFLRRQHASRAVRQLTATQRAPRHRRQLLSKTLVERAVVQRVAMGEADLNLVGHERKRTGPLQRGQIGRPAIAHPKVPDLASVEQRGERTRDLVRVTKIVRPMNLVEIEVVHAEPLERGLAGKLDMFARRIIAIRRTRYGIARKADAALRSDQYLVAQARRVLQHLAEEFLAAAAAVDVRVIKERVARVDGGQHRALAGLEAVSGDLLRLPTAGNAPASVGETRGF